MSAIDLEYQTQIDMKVIPSLPGHVVRKNEFDTSNNSLSTRIDGAQNTAEDARSTADEVAIQLSDLTSVISEEVQIGTFTAPGSTEIEPLFRRVLEFTTSADGSPIDIDIDFVAKRLWITRGNICAKATSDQQDGTVFSYPVGYANSQYLMEFMARRIDNKIRIRSQGFPSAPGDLWIEYTKNEEAEA